MTEAQMNAICNTLSAQRNAALDQVAMQEAKIVELTEQIKQLTERLADNKKTMPPVQQTLFLDGEERN